MKRAKIKTNYCNFGSNQANKLEIEQTYRPMMFFYNHE